MQPKTGISISTDWSCFTTSPYQEATIVQHLHAAHDSALKLLLCLRHACSQHTRLPVPVIMIAAWVLHHSGAIATLLVARLLHFVPAAAASSTELTLPPNCAVSERSQDPYSRCECCCQMQVAVCTFVADE